jgi:hypothetical protein
MPSYIIYLIIFVVVTALFIAGYHREIYRYLSLNWGRSFLCLVDHDVFLQVVKARLPIKVGHDYVHNLTGTREHIDIWLNSRGQTAICKVRWPMCNYYYVDKRILDYLDLTAKLE